MKISEKESIEETGKAAATLSIIEIGLGSLLHSFKIPFAGHFLSLNQIAFLSRISFKLKSKKSALEISLITSFLKSLSPSGKKLTPMLAIAAQGIFYYLGLFLFGTNYLGLLVAVIFSSLWGFIQPILFIYLLFGKNSVAVAEHFLNEFKNVFPNCESYLIAIVLTFVILKCILAYWISVVAIKVSEERFTIFQNKFNIKVKPKNYKTSANYLMAIYDLLNPTFIISFILTSFFFIFSNSSKSAMIWGLLRPLAIGYIIFYAIRVYPTDRLVAFLRKMGFIKISKTLEYAISIINNRNKDIEKEVNANQN